MKILLAVDGSAHSHDAVRHLIEHASWYREMPVVELVYVHLPLPDLPYLALSADQMRKYYEDEGAASLAKAKHLLDAAGISCTTRLLVGPVAESIVNEARHAGCDLILLGTRGTGAGGNLLLGSTATKVLYFSNLPVMVINSARP
jgi:nucleotide-binding universal stress UspA family protein